MDKLRAIIGVSALVLVNTASAAIISLDSIDNGWVTSTGEHTTTNTNTWTGDYNDIQRNSFYTFDVSQLANTAITSVTLEFRAGNGTYNSTANSLLLEIWDATDLNIDDPSTASVATYNDLQSGVLYGNTDVDTPTGVFPSMPSISLSLSADSFGDILQNDLFTLGAHVNLSSSVSDAILWSSSSGLAAATLTVDYDTVSVPEPSVLALMGIGLAGLGFARRRKIQN